MNGSFSQEHRSLRGDWSLSGVHTNMRGMDRVENQNLFPRLEMSKTRRNNFKVGGGKFIYFLTTQRVVGDCNKLPGMVLGADTIVAIKRL